MKFIQNAGCLLVFIVAAALVYDVPSVITKLSVTPTPESGFEKSYRLWSLAADNTYRLVIDRESADPGEALVDEPLELKWGSNNLLYLSYVLNAAEPHYKTRVRCTYWLFDDHYELDSGSVMWIHGLGSPEWDLNEGPEWKKSDGVDLLGRRWCPASTHSTATP
jgi:hypothetical protein